MLEKVIYNKIIPFVRPKLSLHQYGFLKQRSCLTQLLTAFAEIHQAVDKRTPSDVVYVDFCKAFDTVPHQELLFKLWNIGITGSLNWFCQYLSDCRHYTSVDGVGSDFLAVTSGVVPQGSVLGPLLYIIYINDVPNVINFSIYIFADDTKFVRFVSSFKYHVAVGFQFSPGVV